MYDGKDGAPVDPIAFGESKLSITSSNSSTDGKHLVLSQLCVVALASYHAATLGKHVKHVIRGRTKE